MSNVLNFMNFAAAFSIVSAATEEDKTKKAPIDVPANHVMIRSALLLIYSALRIMDFQMEIVLVSVFILYFLVWLRGKKANLNKAKAWLNGQSDYLRSQFALVGDRKSNDQSILMMDGPADYLLYTTGRRNVQFGHWWLKLKPRNDILTFFSTQVLSMLTSATRPAADRVELKLHLDKGLSEKFVVGVVKKDLAADLFKKRFDLSRVGKIASSKAISSSEYTIYAETQKLADLILTPKVTDIINNSNGRLESLIISSLPDEEPELFETDSYITISLNMLMSPTNEFDPLVELVGDLPDAISQLRLSGDIKSKINKNREELGKEYAKKIAADRAEELAKKKAEAKRAEEERVKKLSPAEQRKWEEKERARNMKKLQKKQGKKM
ncbi:hypothetical protein [Parasitella parasitica]|uniref:DUF1682-domain-containing protein n=1 Tax=Parasitella parasitica TaxID=35722 RepID=A0A0B7N9D1_9FUNG|nr:hypothetical protein [Parasitella parasitica]